jgi:P-type Cu2+ transporter
LAVAGFAASNVMLISIGTWAGAAQNMGPATRDLMHWVSALIAMPAIAYAGRPFFRSAFAALRHGAPTWTCRSASACMLVTAMSLCRDGARRGAHLFRPRSRCCSSC